MKKSTRIRKLFVRRVSPLSVPMHIKVNTRPGRPLIRENSWHLNRRSRALLNTVNLLGWTIWLVLFGLVLTSLAWSAGVWFVRREWVEAEGIRGLSRFIENDLPVGISFCVVFLAWSTVRAMMTNRNKVARRRASRAKMEKLTEVYSPKDEKSSDALLAAQKVQCLMCHHDAHGELENVDQINLTVPQIGQPLGLKDRLITKTPGLEAL